MKRSALFMLILCSIAALFGPAERFRADAADKRPNIVFIFSDDHAAQAISAYGSNRNKTPHLDRIANEGMRFENCFCTNSLCGPSRAVIQTGKYSHINGFRTNGDRFDGSQQTFPKLLQKAGYQTAVVGKWHLVSSPQGFDYHNILIGQGPYYNPPMIENGEKKNYTGYTTEIITDHALNWLKNGRDKDKPFMLMYQHKAPHRNWQPGPKYLTMYDDVVMPEPPTLFDDYEGRGTAAHTQDMMISKTMNANDLKLTEPRGLTPEQLELWNAAYGPKNKAFEEAKLTGKDLIRWKYQRYMKDYLRCVAAVDDNVGRVLDWLDETGLADNTVVIYTSDQGFFLGEHGWFDKRFMYEESYRMPLMVRWPGVVAPKSVNDDLVSNIDFAETFLDIAGVGIPADMQGRSLVDVLKGKTPADWRTALYYQYYEFPGAHSVRRHFGVRTKDFKLMNFYNLEEWELFDLQKDPQEMMSVYDDPNYAGVVKKLKQEIEQFQDSLKVPDDSGTVSKDGKRIPQPKTGKPKT